MTHQHKFKTAEEFLNHWWTVLDNLVVSGNICKPHSPKTREMFTAIPCDCNADFCCGWSLHFKGKEQGKDQ